MVYVTQLKDWRKGLEDMAEQDSPDPLANYLRHWGLEMYISQFKGFFVLIANELKDDPQKKLQAQGCMLLHWYWDATTKQMLTGLMNNITVEEYIRQFKPLSQPGGVLLLIKDFKVLHPRYDDNLHQNWLLIRRPNLIDYAKMKQDSTLAEILSNIENDSEEILNVVGFMTLPFLKTKSIIKRDKAKKQWRPSKREVLQSFICHLKSAAEIEETIQRRKTKLQVLKITT